MRHASPLRRNCLKLTALSAALLLASANSSAAATSWTVDTCADNNAGSGTSGSLRYTLAHAASGDTIDITQLPLACSKITLTDGFLIINQNDLTLTGPGAGLLTISGAHNSVVIHDDGQAGTLTINDLTLADGFYSGPVNPQGACLYSHTDVMLVGSAVTNCSAEGTLSVIGKGGGVYSHGNVSLIHSTISGNSVSASGSATSRGGGVYALGTLYMNSSVIDGNLLSAAGSSGGGVFAYGDVQVLNSTISDNTAGSGGGGITARANVSIAASTISGNHATNGAGINATGTRAQAAVISNSTVSGNAASGNDGGIYAHTSLTLDGVTVAFNSAAVHGGIYAKGNTLELQSSILSNNSAGASPSDLDAAANVSLSGANDLILHSSVAVPPGTLTGCPLLGPLRDNGGITLTHALSSGSAAINTGNNVISARFDQRSIGYPRVSGTAADIGAYELQQPDIIFSAGFEGCE